MPSISLPKNPRPPAPWLQPSPRRNAIPKIVQSHRNLTRNLIFYFLFSIRYFLSAASLQFCIHPLAIGYWLFPIPSSCRQFSCQKSRPRALGRRASAVAFVRMISPHMILLLRVFAFFAPLRLF
jgi:hypothetical protein